MKRKPDAEWYNAANNRMCGEPRDGARCGSRPSAARVQCPTDSRCTHQACMKHAENEPEALGAHHICIGRHKTGVEGRGESAHILKVDGSCHCGCWSTKVVVLPPTGHMGARQRALVGPRGTLVDRGAQPEKP